MKVLFLDIDGVLTHRGTLKADAETFLERKVAQLDKAAVERLNYIVDSTGCAVVVSSAWRTVMEKSTIQYVLNRAGFRHLILDVTPPDAGSRGQDITNWCDSWGYPITQICVLDDGNVSPYEDVHVQTDLEYGLLDEHTTRVIRILGRRIDVDED